MKISTLINFFRGHTRGAKAKREMLYSLFIDGISVLIGLFYVPLLLNFLTQEKYGIWLTLTSILGWFSFFDIGLGNGLRNKLTEAFANKNMKLGKKLVSTTYALLICIFSVVLLIFHLCNFFLDWNSILNTNTIENRELYILTSIVFTFFILRFIVQIISVVYLADQRPSISKLITTSGNLVSFLIVLILTRVTLKGDLILLGTIISAIPVVLFLVVSITSFNSRYKQLKPSIKEIDLKVSNGLVNFGAKFFVLQISYLIAYTTSNILITQFYGPAEVTIYNIAYKYFYIPVMVYSIILSPIWSAVTDAYIKSDYVWLKKTLKHLNLLSLLFVFGIVFMIIISNWVYKIWVGGDIVIPFSLSLALGLYSITVVIISPFSAYINGLGKLDLTIFLTLFGVPVYLGLAFVFSRWFDNSTGIVLAVLSGQIIGLIAEPLQIHKLLYQKAKGIWNK
ncbi:MAG: oligosaccharide flippase family protein [Draconibacterium sp.]|nr:oligosaccharide flippase family protein [Draconibacterium sp.]